MKPLQSFKRKLLEHKYGKEKVAIDYFRHELCMWGIDTTSLTDQEIIFRVKNVSTAIGNAGISAEEASKALTSLSIQ